MRSDKFLKFQWVGEANNNLSRVIILAHGAGAPMDSPFMEKFSNGLHNIGLNIARFEFPYMVKTRKDGIKRPPDKIEKLLMAWRDVIVRLSNLGIAPKQLIIGGKSLGGRVASMIADEQEVAGLVCLGYPFHPPGKPNSLRIEHLKSIRTQALFIQGERDIFGSKGEVEGYPLSKKIRIHWAKDGDHSLKPRKLSGMNEKLLLNHAVVEVADFVRRL